MWGCFNSFPFSSFGGGFPFFGLIVLVVIVIAAIWVIRTLIPDSHPRQNARADRDDALRILRVRLAEGSISEEEFERLKRAVES
ncbi:Protein of unknown function DUF2078, membrane [Solidesulfovibrio fructosivorans JJ]]|uniref:SHOCT domain-containing protein n=1 Tax=Solidesulfovibrio fructosivorans JJ] TaxID=596151 RepID=E1JVD9_SOLFR|nr:SHOCT domain-containing protein [Solidesulfovibrio fructosivorans]EFL51733.1 Protein of unknown function DUF2078, membrane [Solidesulfovibrio fructosivorans JJ]]